MGLLPLFDLTENLTQCREHHRKQFCNWSKVVRSLGLTFGGQKVSLHPFVCKWNESESEKPFTKALSFSRLFNPGARLAYLTSTGQTKWSTDFRLITKLLPMIFFTLCHQPNRTEVDFPIGLVCVILKMRKEYFLTMKHMIQYNTNNNIERNI